MERVKIHLQTSGRTTNLHMMCTNVSVTVSPEHLIADTWNGLQKGMI
jgi:hypothetical protein